MIEFQQVSKSYHDKHALVSANFHLQRGDMAFLTGHSGAGKSTLLKLIMLMERPTSGKVIVDRQDLSQLSRTQVPAHRRKIGLVFQNHQLLLDYSVFDNVALPLKISGYNERDSSRRVRAALDKVGLLDKEKLSPSVLSSGEQQRIGIARAIVNKPKLILADEPTGNLDPALSAEVMRLFQQFNQVGVSVLIASHDLNLIQRLPHPVIQLNQGQLSGPFAMAGH
ncbi:MAG: cell division ATP-binding protein FtsE [Oceanospirillaceae bacterium]|jgi:cell division transport system ATP-binding protein|nr:cell division ATP-binding protein FtsE [Oceanospirillaceae bacterium]MBT4443906.1 cell division ATP-binding protein FtsE [Oceanospirillaceae bacterium]MBT6078348.1 cell division ATP-binding protein FtsE [Oceanospirillaceae bacterium]MBT7331383.1 cell division ATP-binding protein FtsE [Oceanospirillaceae bacterium]